MTRNNYYKLFCRTKHLFLICLFYLMGSTAFAQKVSSDDLLKQALVETNIKKNYPLAIKLSKEGLQISPGYTDIRVLLGRLYLLTENYSESIKELKKVLDKQPDNADALVYIINAHYQNNQLDQAVNYCAQYLSYNPTNKKMLIKKIAIIGEMQDFKKAETELIQALNHFPNDPDLIYLHQDLLFTKVNTAIKRNDTTAVLEGYAQLLTSYPKDTIARNRLIDLQVERKNYASALNYIDTGLTYYPNQESLLLKKIGIVQVMGNTRQAYQLSKKAVAAYPENRKIRNVNNELFVLSRQNQLGLNYAITAFDQDGKKPWGLYSVSYLRTEKMGTLAARINYADRNNLTGYQFEVETYPTHGSTYSYVNLSYSDDIVFPKFRFSYSYFMPFKSWETEVGVRYLKNIDDNFFGLTAAVGKYFGAYWLNLKTFLTPNGQKLANSYTLTGRYYLNSSSDDYFTAIAGYGFSPDDRGRNFEINSRLNMEAIRFTLGYQRTLWRTNILGIFGTYNNQQYQNNIKRNEYEASIAFRHKF
jgi:YaiO family outer membrane protein